MVGRRQQINRINRLLRHFADPENEPIDRVGPRPLSGELDVVDVVEGAADSAGSPIQLDSFEGEAVDADFADDEASLTSCCHDDQLGDLDEGPSLSEGSPPSSRDGDFEELTNLRSLESSDYLSDAHSSDHADSESDLSPSSSSEEEGDLEEEDLEDWEVQLLQQGEVDGPTELKQFLADWATSQTIPGTSVNNLLKGLKGLQHQGTAFNGLPADVRTLLKTPRNVVVDNIGGGGTCYHFGLEKGIQTRLALRKMGEISPSVKVYVNVDGLPLSKSSRSEFWACLGRLEGETEPFAIAIHHSTGKPGHPDDFLQRTITEMNHLKDEGLVHRGVHVQVRIHCFSCDAPARSFICGIVGHTGYYACPKCVTRGQYYTKPGAKKGRVVYPDMDAALRSHQSFMDREHPNHHNTRTVLEDLNIDMVADIPFDYMHLVCLGVMRKLLKHWVSRTTSRHLITQADLAEISRRLIALRKSVPREFSRLPRPLAELSRWKATEFRQFLLYTGPIILQDVLPKPLYDHFLCLHVAIKILVSKKYCIMFNAYSKHLIRHFVKESEKLYGRHFISYNIHGLLHLPDDVLRFGPLDSFSCFSFENFLQQLKKKVRRAPNPLVQVVKRLSETVNCRKNLSSQSSKTSSGQNLAMSHSHSKGPIPDGYDAREVSQFKVAQLQHWRLTTQSPNNCVILEDGSVVLIENFIRPDQSSVMIVGRAFMEVTNLLNPPFDANGVLQCKCVQANHMSELTTWPLEFVQSKMFIMPTWKITEHDDDMDESYFAVYPLLMEDKDR